MKPELKILHTSIHAGLPHPCKLLHVTDSHITRDDPTGWDRCKTFDTDYPRCSEEYFTAALAYARQEGMPLLHTGDLIDFFSPGNFAYLKEHLADLDYFYAAGNHDFCHFLGQAREDTAYKWGRMPQIAPYIGNNLYFSARLYQGLNIITLDNSYYRFRQGQLDMLRAEVARGYPILLAMHVPLYTPEQAQAIIAENHECAYLCGAPEELLATYPEERRWTQQPDDVTLSMIHYIKNEPLICAIIAGHTHRNFEDRLNDRLMQYTTHGSFAGYVREITVT